MSSFKELGLKDSLVSAVDALGFINPMPIQEKIIPLILQDETDDVIALAQTGTGKTAAFGLPIIQKIDTKLKKVQYLIICPTRELCLQIADDLKDYSVNDKDIIIAAVFGGSSMDRQIQKIKQGAQIISATPGRLNDLINRKVVDLSKVKAVVLDEADEMLNMGFKEELEAILEKTPEDRNTFLFSATMPKQLLSIANKYMFNPVEITIGVRNAGAENVEHISYIVQAKDRYLALKRIVDFYPNIYGIVFCRTRQETKEVSEKLMQDGYNADALHGDLSQPQREYVMNKFRTRNLRLLVATDVAARGLDVDDLTHIINYDLPDELEVYTHRSGRTGRAGKAGTSIVIAHLKEKYKINQIEKQLNKKFTNLPIPSGRDICEKQLFHLIDRVEKVEIDHVQVESFLPQIYNKLEWMDRNELIQRFVSVEFNRFLDYYRNLPDISSPTDGKSFSKEGTRSSRRANYTRYFINLGTTDGLKPAQLIGMINDFTGIRNIDIGEIDIMKNFSFFEADSNYQSEVIEGFKGQRLKKREISVEVAEKRRGNDRAKRFGGERKSSDKFRKDDRSNKLRGSSEKKKSKKKSFR
ncbi:MAG TPA: DEAD/DEAH box helicase [Ignavibacteriaceae bacterium]|nr:DEAD/DEAH box helicase [Ignavibacteriaceae bacterium]